MLLLLLGRCTDPLTTSYGASTEGSEEQESDSTIRFASWNLNNVDYVYWTPERYRRVAEVIEKKMDFVVVLEMTRSEGISHLLQSLQTLDAAWEVIKTDRKIGNRKNGEEYYTVYYRSSKLVTCPGWTQHLQLYTDGPWNDHLNDVNGGIFSRPPAIGCFQLDPNWVSDGSDGFLFAAYHARYGDHYAQRVLEAFQLHGVFEQMATYPTDGQIVNVTIRDQIIVGDFNVLAPDTLCITELWKHSSALTPDCEKMRISLQMSNDPTAGIVTRDFAALSVMDQTGELKWPSSMQTMDPEDLSNAQRVHGKGSTIQYGKITSNLIDHLFVKEVPDSLFSEHARPSVGVLDFASALVMENPWFYLEETDICAGSSRKAITACRNAANAKPPDPFAIYSACYSDHLPIVTEIGASKP